MRWSAACTAGSSMDLRGGSGGSPAPQGTWARAKQNTSHGTRLFQSQDRTRPSNSNFDSRPVSASALRTCTLRLRVSNTNIPDARRWRLRYCRTEGQPSRKNNGQNTQNEKRNETMPVGTSHVSAHMPPPHPALFGLPATRASNVRRSSPSMLDGGLAHGCARSGAGG